MADTVVSFVLENLSQLVAHEANLLCGVEDKVKSLESELRMMNVFLKSCEQNQRKKEIEQEVVRQIKDIAHEAEDVLDTFVANVARNRRRSWLSRMLHGVDHAKLLHHVAGKIDNIKVTIDQIYENRKKYDIQEAAGCSTEELQLLHKRRRDVEEDDVVGFQLDTTEVINLLKQGDSGRNVVSIIGMGGLGKTTLARKIYNSHHVKNYFQCRAWVYVSNDYRPRELLLALLKCLMSNSANTSYYNNNSSRKHKKKRSKGEAKAKAEDDYSFSEEELKDKVRECLKGTRYLVVLDDIWRPQHWDDLQYAFPDDNKSSRILITSRVKEVASHASSSPPYYLPFLNEEESWELFSKRVFRGEVVPSDLELLGKCMVKSCGGLPISIVVLAGILANKEKSYREWSKIMGHVNSYLTQPETQVQDIVLKLSYDSLPPRLRPCFLYFGMFPEDYEIHVRSLIQVWVAEGFILHSNSRIAEDVAEDYLDELIDRSLIQVGRRRSDGGIKTCRIHDLLRELCISESKEEKVFEVCGDANILEQTKPRRLSIQCDMSDFFVSNNKDLSGTRSVLRFNSHYFFHFDSTNSKKFVKLFQLVRVLDLGLPILYERKVPTNLNMLLHLRYLRIDPGGNFTGRHGMAIPKFICNLWNLETLDLGRSQFKALSMPFSRGMWKLKRLRHLHTAGHVILPEFPDVESKTMWNLQTLSCVAINKKSALVSLIRKGVFPKLRRLGLYFYKDDKHKQGVGEVWENLTNLKYLDALKIYGFPDIPTSVNVFPSNLIKLAISRTNLNNDVMSTLGSLTNLRILKLCDCEFAEASRSESELRCINGFPQLEAFKMQSLNMLCHWELGKDVMPCLRRLIIKECRRLTALPDELWFLTSLREIQVAGLPESLKKQLQSQPIRDGCNLIIH